MMKLYDNKFFIYLLLVQKCKLKLLYDFKQLYIFFIFFKNNYKFFNKNILKKKIKISPQFKNFMKISVRKPLIFLTPLNKFWCKKQKFKKKKNIQLKLNNFLFNKNVKSKNKKMFFMPIFLLKFFKLNSKTKFKMNKQKTFDYKNQRHKFNKLFNQNLLYVRSKNLRGSYIYRVRFNAFFNFNNNIVNQLQFIWSINYRVRSSFALVVRRLERLKFDYLNINIQFLYRKIKLLIFGKFKFYIKNLRPKQFWVSKITHVSLIKPRRDFISYWNKKFEYQKPLTKFILTFYRLKSYDLLVQNEFTLKNILLRNLFFQDESWYTFFLNNGFIYLNNSIIYRDTCNLKPLDVIQLPVSLKFFIFWKYQLKTYYSIFKKFRYFVYKYRIKTRRPFPKTSSFRIPYWIKYINIPYELFPMTCEFDFTIMTIIILQFNYYNFFKYSYFSWNSYVSNNVKSFNWKYLT